MEASHGIADGAYEWVPQSALITYRNTTGSGLTIATVHKVNPNGTLRKGRRMRSQDLTHAADALRAGKDHLTPQILPHGLLYHDPGTCTIWVSPQQRRKLTFRPKFQPKLNNRLALHPRLLFCVEGRNLRVFALPDADTPPDADTALRSAPYWNTGSTDSGYVEFCNVKAPGTADYSNLRDWEAAFYDSRFTHRPHGKRLKKGSVESLWKKQLTARSFPYQQLLPAGITIAALALAKT